MTIHWDNENVMFHFPYFFCVCVFDSVLFFLLYSIIKGIVTKKLPPPQDDPKPKKQESKKKHTTNIALIATDLAKNKNTQILEKQHHQERNPHQ